MDNITLYEVAVVPLIIGATEAIKRTVKLPASVVPAVAVSLGLAAGVALNYGDWPKAVVTGLALGLASIGLYSGTKNTVEEHQ